MDWRYGSSSRATALQVQKPESHHKKKEREREKKHLIWAMVVLQSCDPVIMYRGGLHQMPVPNIYSL
jgi:hypothetical protein